jgi:hypothetical protein
MQGSRHSACHNTRKDISVSFQPFTIVTTDNYGVSWTKKKKMERKGTKITVRKLEFSNLLMHL